MENAQVLNKEEDQKKNKEEHQIQKHYVYFIETHLSTKKIKIVLSPNYPEWNTIECLETINLNKNSSTFITSIYRFVIYHLINNNDTIKIISQDNNIVMKDVEISNIDPLKNTFLFDINIYLNLFEYKLDLYEEFDIFISYLKEKVKLNKNSEEFGDLLTSILYYLNDNYNTTINFPFYITLFLESFDTKYFYNVLELFNSERVKDTDVIDQNKLDKYKENIYKIEDELNNKVISDVNVEDKLKINAFIIIYYFYFKFDQERLKKIINYNNIIYIKKGLIKHKHFLRKIKLPNNVIIRLIREDYSFNDLEEILSYNRDFLSLLENINENIEFFNGNLDGVNSIIHIDKIITAKKEDNANINKLNEEINKILTNEKKYNKKFVKLSPNIFDKYISIYYFDNEKIMLLYNIIKDIQKVYPDFKLDNKIDFIIHQNTIKKAMEHKMSNIEILDYIQNNQFYNDNKYNLIKYRNANIISGIDINEINMEFISKWNEIDFVKVFDKNYYNFVDQVCRLVKDISYFGLLYELLNTSKDKNNIHLKKFNYNSIELMQKTFEILINTYDIDRCPNFINDVTNLIYYSDQVKYKEINLVENIQKMLNSELVDQIYHNLLTQYNDISEEVVDKILAFFTDNSWNINVSVVLEFINKCPKIKGKIMKKLNKYIIQENEFYEIEETNNYKLLSGLMKSHNFNQMDNNLEVDEYIENSLIVISGVEQKIKDLDINYNLIAYFIDSKNEQLLYERLLIISILNEKEAKHKLNLLIKNTKIIKSAINNIQSYLDKMTLFFSNKYYLDLNELKTILNNIKVSTIKKYIEKYSFDYSNYLTKLNKDYERIGKKSDSYFFITVYNDIKTKKSLDDENTFTSAITSFGKMKDIFAKNKLKDSDGMVEMCLMPFKGKEEELKKEIETDIELLNLTKVKDKFQLYNDMLIILKRTTIMTIIEDLKVFIDKMGCTKGDFFKELNNINSYLQKRKVKYIQQSIDILTKNEINIDGKDKNNKIFLSTLHLIKNQLGSIDFLFNYTIEDCKSIQELPGVFDSGFLSVEDIFNLEKSIIFMNKFRKRNELDIKMIKEFREELLRDNNSIYFMKYINNYPILNELMVNGLDRAEMSKNKVSLILENSEFTITNINKEFFKCFYFDKNRNNKNELIPSNLTLKELFDIRDRAQLNRSMISQDGKDAQKNEKIILNNKIFIELVSEVNNVYGLLQEIYWKGFSQEIICKIKIQNDNIVYNIENKDYKEFEEVVKIIKDILEKIKSQQILGYKNMKLIRYFFGLHFDYFYKRLNEPRQKHLFELLPFLNYCTNELIKQNLSSFNYKKSKNIYEDIIVNCERYLKNLLEINKLTLEKIYQNTIICKKTKIGLYKGIYTYLSESLEKDLFQIYKYFTNNNPVAQNILLCNKDTTKEEIIAFLYRTILCEFNSFFIIGGIETLGFEKRKIFLDLINNLYVDNFRKMRACLLILYINKTSDIYKWLELEKTIKKLDIIKADYENEKYIGNKIEIIYSDKSGVGKSRQIKDEILGNNKKYIYFPFGGVLERDHILYRLKKLELDDNCTIHIDLYDTDQISLMMEFLFSVLITRLYGKNDNIFYLSKDINIKIEIPNSFIDFFAKFPMLNLFPKKMLSINNLAPLIVSQEITSNIQIVCNYLKDLKDKNIDNKDLFFPGITPEYVKTEELPNRKKNEKKHEKTGIDAKVLSQGECKDLIFEIIKTKIKNPTYYQINTFIDILGEQLKNFNQNYYLNAFQLRTARISYIRTFIVRSFIKLTEYFTKGAFTDLLKSQEQTHNYLNKQYNEGEDIKKAINDLAKNDKKEVVSFDKIDNSLLFFYEGEGQSFSVITNKPKNDQEYKDLLKLKNSQVMNKKDLLKELPNYKGYSQKQFLEELKEILEIKNPVEKDTKNPLKSLEEIAGNYVFTADNFIKMVLILLRIRSNIPVIMMGETGCGKTSLIRKLSELKNDGNADKMKILNIHAGTTDQDIIDFIEKKVIDDARDLALKELERKNEYKEKGLRFVEKKLWVFLDEINTCKSMGLISELMCKHTYQGNVLFNNIVFIAACNPYRQKEYKNKENVGLNINQAHQQKKYLNERELEDIKLTQNNNLVYTVNPLPHSLLNFVFDFGNLAPEDEKSYIKCMIEETIKKKINENRGNFRDSDINDIIELAQNLIVECHKFIRKNKDVSSVSLREIRRFNIFYEFFYDFIKGKKTENKSNINIFSSLRMSFQGVKEFDIHISAINLSIFVCYYMRITNKKLRKDLSQLLNDKLYNLRNSNVKKFLEIPLSQQKLIVDNIQLDKGIAKNKALLENIFSLFVAINNKVPIFIVGKPGCSKSLSVQLMTKSMRGYLSINPLFKEFPKVIVNSYQGSMGSTSEGVENVFKKARKVLQDLNEEEKNKNISMIFFDEMGLAEHSPNNPLKVIHAELEYDLNEGDKKVAFVGISNWELDASKMNRGLSLYIPEPDEEDMKETALTIGKSYHEILADKFRFFFENLGKVYFEYKQYLKEFHSSDGKEDFHGNRDFYHLVKNAGINLAIKYMNNDVITDNVLGIITINSIERNFSGIEFKINENEKITSLEVVKNIYKKIYPNFNVNKEYDVIQRIKENIFDLNSRYLLVIANPSISVHLLSSILLETNKNYNLFIGSEFEEDHKSEEYSLKVLNKVQLHMEQGNILILNNLESVYPNLYDLFNQNFTVLGNKNYARLAVGSTTNTFSFVNNNFRCIVNVDINQIDNEEAPFLNRFEKHILSYEYLLSNELLDEAQRIYNILNELTHINSNIYKGANYDFSKLLINCNLENIQAIIYEANKRKVNIQYMINEVIAKIALLLPQDIYYTLKLTKFSQKYSKYTKIIEQFYKFGEHINFANFIKKLTKTKNVVYTFSNNLVGIEDINIENPKYGKFMKENISQIEISSIKCEKELDQQLDIFYSEEKYKLCIIILKPYEGRFMNYLKCFIENKEKDFEINKKDNNKNSHKIFIFIISVVRIFNSELKDFDKKPKKEQNEINNKILRRTLSSLSEYHQIFIDNLNANENLSVEKILQMKRDEIFLKCLDVDRELLSNIYTSLNYINYDINSSVKNLNKNTYVNKFMYYIRHNAKVRKLINECIIRQIIKEEDIITKIFKKRDSITADDVDLPSIIMKYLSESYAHQLNLFIFKAEKDHFFSSLLSSEEDPIINIQNNNSKSNNNKKKKKKNENLINTKTFDDPDKDDIDYVEDIKMIKKDSLFDDDNNDDGIWNRNIIEITKEIYLENLLFNDGITKVTEKQGSNNLKIILGFRLPGLKTTIDKIIKKIRDTIVPKYYKNEDDLRRNKNEGEQLEKDKNDYKEELRRLNYMANLEIENHEIINLIKKGYINNQDDLQYFYDLLLDDYYTFYINNNLTKANENNVDVNNENNINNNNIVNNQGNNNINDNNNNIFDKSQIEDTKQLLKLLVNLRNKYTVQEDDNIKQIGSIIAWIETYTVEITSILKMYNSLRKIVGNLYEQINRIIERNEIIFENSERNPEYKSLVNKAFFIVLESLLRVITSNENIYINLKEDSDKFFELINIDKQLHQDGLQLNTSLSLFGKEVFTLQEILIIFRALEVNNLTEEKKIENLTKTIQFFSKQTILIIKGKKSDLISNLSKLFEFLSNNIKKDDNYGEIINSILLNEFHKIIYEEYRQKIIEIILKDDNLISNSTKLIKIIMDNTLDHSIEGIKRNLEILHDSKSKIIKMLNDAKKIFLDEILIGIFETKINIYFDLIPSAPGEVLGKYFHKLYLDLIKDPNNKIGIILEQSFHSFKIYIEYLELAALEKKKKHNSHLIKLYSLTYVKIYLSKLVYILKNNNKQLGDISFIMDVIKGKTKNNFRKVIKIYIFKLFYSLMNNYEEFQNFDFLSHKIDFANEFKIATNVNQDVLNNYFIPLDTDEIYKKFMEQYKQFDSCRRNKFPLSESKKFGDYLRTNGIDMFLSMSMNKIISNLGLNKINNDKKNDYNNFSNFQKNLFSKEYIFKNHNMNTLLSLFFDENTFAKTVKPKILIGKNINQKLFEMLLYGFRYCVQSLSVREYPINKKDFLYESLLSKNCLSILKENYIPTNDLIDDLHLTTFGEIQNHLNTLSDRYGCYVCSCGYYYSIEPCGFPSKGNTSKCPVCKKDIGWGPKVVQKGYSQHGMVIRPGHWRIYKNAQQKKTCEGKYGDPSENIPNKLLADYKREVIDPLNQKGQKGLNIVNKQLFEKSDKKIRNLNELSYRLIHFISYSHLFFANCMGYISNNDLQKNCLVTGMKCIEILEKDWDIIKEKLQQKRISSIQIFMNLIFKRVSDLIKNCGLFKVEKDRNNFENDIQNVINQCLKEYNNYSIKYMKENKNQLSYDNYDIRTIICELNPPDEKIYTKKDYPLLKYFMLTKYKSKQDFIQRLGPSNIYIIKYPLLGQYLLDKSGPKKMKYLPDFNEFTNYMVDNYSFKISRDDAKRRILENEEIFKDPNFEEKFNKFINSWDEIKKESIKYKCRPEMKIKTISKYDSLSYFLNDDGELGHGMYLAAACQNFISWQNSFLQPIIDSVIHNGILHYYVNNLQKRIPVQTAKINQTLLLEDCFKKSEYANFDELIYTFSTRDIFKNDGTINYYNYNSFKYNFDKIEEEFGRLLLPGICLFESEDILNFVTFWSEGFRGGKSDTLSSFYLKYPQKDLTDNEKTTIINYINSIISNSNVKYDFKGFFGSLQLLIFYLSNNETKKDEKIVNIINKAPSYLKLTNDCSNFFNRVGNQFNLDKLMNIFFFIEHLCFNDLIETLQPEYRMEIDINVIQRIREKLLSNKNNEGRYTISDLAAAVRRFISRYLVGKRQTTDINENRDLIFDLCRTDLWTEKIGKIDNLDDIISNQLFEFQLKVGQAYAFYQIISDEDKIPINNLDNNYNNNYNNYNNNIIIEEFNNNKINEENNNNIINGNDNIINLLNIINRNKNNQNINNNNINNNINNNNINNNNNNNNNINNNNNNNNNIIMNYPEL